MMYYSTNRPALAFELPSVITAALGGIPLVLAGAAFLIRVISSRILSETPVNSWGLAGLLNWLMDSARIIGLVAMIIVSVMLVVAIVLHKLLPDRFVIECMARRALFCPRIRQAFAFQGRRTAPLNQLQARRPRALRADYNRRVLHGGRFRATPRN